MKRKISICACSLILLLSSIFNSDGVYAATSTLGDWDKVDSGGHLDWGGDSNYMTEWYGAVNVWNAYKPGVIRVDTWKIVQDVKIMDEEEKDGEVCAETFRKGKIVFYQDAMDTLSSKNKKSVIIHEIGHALGIAHNEYTKKSVMYQHAYGIVKLHKYDKEAYDASMKRID